MLVFRQNGNFSKTNNYFQRLLEITNMSILDKYGKKGVEALTAATPVDTGETANSWSYKIIHKKGISTLEFDNSNVQDGVSIAIILQYGHGTRSGTWVEGIDYINPALQPIFKEISDELWKEVTR